MDFKTILDVLAKHPWGPAPNEKIKRESDTPIVDKGRTEPLKPLARLADTEHLHSVVGPTEAEIREPPAFLRSSNSPRDQTPVLASPVPSKLRAFIAAKRRRMLVQWRRHFIQDISDQNADRLVGMRGGAAFAILTSVVIVTGVGAAIALGQINFLKSETAKLQRELIPLRERLTKLEQIEKARSEQQRDEQNKAEVNNPLSANQTALDLSPEEIQLIKDYIKPAPYSGPPGPAINVGDPVAATMIPLPSPLTDKMPKLLGGKFTIRNGTIIIVKRDSRNAEIVLPPN